MKRPKGRRQSRLLRIAVPVSGGVGWIGGVIYVRNLIYCLAALPPQDTTRP